MCCVLAGGNILRVRGHVVAGGDIFVRPGTFDAVGDGNPVPERAGCPRLERIAPGRAECPPPASGGGDPVRHSGRCPGNGRL